MSHPSQAARRTRRLSGIAAGLAAALVAATATACGSTAGLGSPDEPNLRVGIVDSIGVIPFEYGMSAAHNAFGNAGLSVTVQRFASQPEEIAALSSGRIDIAYGEYSQFLSKVSDIAVNGKIRVISEAYDAAPNTVALMVRKGAKEPVATNLAQACNSLSIVVTNKYSPEFLALSNWFQAQGTPINFLGCASVKEISNPQDAIAAVVSNKDSAIVLQEPYITSAEINSGLRVAEDLAAGNASAMPLDGYFATSDFTRRYPRTTAIFASVMAKLQTSAAERVIIENALNGQSGTDQLVTSTMQIGTFPSGVLAARLDIVLRLMNSAGSINGMLSSATLTNLGAG